MRRVIIYGVYMVVVMSISFACGGKPTTIPPGSRLIMQGDVPLYAVCDRGNLLYVSESGQVQLVPLGCLTGQP